MAMEEEMKILEQIESHNAILKEQSESYKELMKYVNNSSLLLQNKRRQGQKHLKDSIDKESSPLTQKRPSSRHSSSHHGGSQEEMMVKDILT